MKKFSEFITEAKEETHFIGGRDVSGITTTKKETKYPGDKAYDVHYKGEHIGHIETHQTSSVQKKNSVRRVDSGKMRTKWAYRHKDPDSRTHFNYNSKRDATAELVGAHLRSKGEY